MKEKGNDNIIFLNKIYQNAEMGLIGIDTILPKLEDERLSRLISDERSEYESICKEAKDILIKYGAKEEEIGKVKELSSKIMSEVMSINKDDKKIVKMMITGTEKGIIELQENINKYENQDKEILELAKKLLNLEETNREELKEFL